MTIKEKAKDFAGYGIISARDTITTVNMSGKYEGFKAGAQWMLEKATAWIVKQGSKANNGVVMICVEDFVKAMEE